jgi:hypothetical protein
MNMNLKGIMKSLNVKPGQVVSDPYARAFDPQVNEAEGKDHEVSMAKGSLEAIVKHANELMKKLGEGEKDIPGWIQDHIAKSENFIQQANDQYHEYGKNESINEAKYSLMSGYLGNGLTYWNAEEQDESGDYKKVAHIDKGGKLTIYDKSLPSDIKKFLDIQADALKRGVRPGIF